jgi:hypothetical protein
MAMTGRERLLAICRHQKPDRLSWTTLVDQHTLAVLPPELQGRGGLDLYRHLGCDTFLLDGWGTAHAFASPALVWGDKVQERWYAEGDRSSRELTCAAGTLRAEFSRSHPVRFLVNNLDEVKLYREMWEEARFEARDDTLSHQRLTEELGDDGIYTRFWGPSAIPRLLEYDLGTLGFYYLLNDHLEEMTALIEVIHQRELEAFRILAQAATPVITLCENTSTYYISPEVYRRFNGPHVRDFVEIVQGAGKTALVHMCGHVRGLLPQIRQTGLDGSHALTPPHTGDTPWDLALEVLGEDHVIFSALPADRWLLGPVEQIPELLDELLTPRVRRSPFVLGVFADGITVPLERFEAVAAWMRRQG